MKKTDTRLWPVSMARAAATFGDHWNLIIVMQSLMGARRFSDFQSPTGISRNILSQRIQNLIDDGILKKVPDPEGGKRSQYRLTSKGLEMAPILFAMAQWEDRFNSDPNNVPQQFWHTVCGNPTEFRFVCTECDQPIDHTSVAIEFLTPEAIEFALQHCANPIVVKKS